MKIEKNSVVRFHYSVADAGGAALESSRQHGQPLAVLIGHGGLIAGLETALLGREAGEQFQVDVTAADAYGPHREGFTQRIPKKYFRDAKQLRPGLQTSVQSDQGPRLVTVIKVGMNVVDVDLNHPMAGRDLRFDIEVVEVRAASPEELEHRHVHGEGGHHH